MQNQKIDFQPEEKKKNMVSRIATDAMLSAVCVVLCLLKVPIGGIVEISLSSLPVLLCAFLFGPVDAMAVALCGSYIEQLLSYGMSPTTPLWMAPLVLMGLVAGLLAVLTSRIKMSHATGIIAVVLPVVISETIFTIADTAVIYIDAKIFGYPVNALNIILPARLINLTVRAAFTSTIMIMLLPKLRKTVYSLKIRRKGKCNPEMEDKSKSQN